MCVLYMLMTCQLMYVPIPMTLHTVPKWQSPSQLVQETKATYALALSSLAARVYDVTMSPRVTVLRCGTLWNHGKKALGFQKNNRKTIGNHRETIGKP